MIRCTWCHFTLTMICAFGSSFLSPHGVRSDDSEAIRLIVRGDDIGSSHAANGACIRCYRDGIVRSVEVMVSAPWFNEAARMLNENPQLDVGVHLTLTSEWENCKWGPLTEAPSLVDEQGHFYPMTSQRKGFPPNTSSWRPARRSGGLHCGQDDVDAVDCPAGQHSAGVGSFTALFRVSGIRPVLEHGSANKFLSPAPP